MWPKDAAQYLRQAMTYAQSKGMQVLAQGAPFGYSNDVLNTNPNWAEGERIIGARFAVDPSGRRLRFLNNSPGLADGGFEAAGSAWLGKHDPGVEIDPLTSHSGTAAGVIHNAPGNARFLQTIHLTPWRQYHIRLSMKSHDYRGSTPALEVLDAPLLTFTRNPKTRLFKYLNIPASQEWTQFDATFNSQESTRASLYFGVWGASSGTLWFDDISLEETALVNLLRRPGTPLKLYDPQTGAAFQEGREVDAIADPLLTGNPQSDYHQPPAITLSTPLQPGRIIAIDYYAAQPVYSHQLSLCFTEPAIQNWLRRNAETVAAAVPPGTGFFLQYDEIRQMNSCAACRAKNMTAGELLAWHVNQTVNLYRSLRPSAGIYVWSDMFDPYANAHDNYFLVEGDLAGSAKGLPADAVIMNWNLERLRDSLTWFSGRTVKQPVAHRQIIAGYYDTHDGDTAASAELRQAAGIPGIDGLMYTTWVQDYTQLKPFANAAKRHWAEYTSSLAKH